MTESWEENSILKTYTEETPCKEIFQAVCDKIGEHYVSLGWKYARSRPKITFKDSEIKIEISFWSSGSNMPGSYVNLEIIPAISSISYVKEMKKQGIKTKGYLLGLSNLFTIKSDSVGIGKKKSINIFGEEHISNVEGGMKGILRYNHNVNVYGIKKIDFQRIIEFIDNHIVVWKTGINEFHKIEQLVKTAAGYSRTTLKRGDFIPYIEFKFGNLKAEQISQHLK